MRSKTILGAMALSLAAIAGERKQAPPKPNVIFIMADDLGWKDVGFMGATFFETPHVDSLSKQSMVFTRGYSGGPNCSPTRACLMSGTYTPRHHIYQPGGMSKGNLKYMKLLVPARGKRSKDLAAKAAKEFDVTNSLDPKFICIPEVLKTAGYTTARLGKWHLGDDTQGFDLSSSDGKGGPGGSFYGNVDVAESLTDRAVKFIEENKKGPFFLYLCHWDVHSPHKSRKAVADRYRAKLEKIPQGERQNFNPVYAGMIEAVDKSVGRVVAKVDELGLAENTLIVFTSDNGGLTSMSQLKPLRGCKGGLFEGGVRIPMCMRWNGVIKPGTSCATPVTSVDFLPTFAALAGAKTPTTQPVDGTDVSPLMLGKTIPERNIFWHYPMYLSGDGHTIDLPNGGKYHWRGVPATAMRRGKYKLVEYFEDNSIALYDTDADVGEQNDLADKMPELAAKMRADLDAWQAEIKAPIPSIVNPDYDLSAAPEKKGGKKKKKK